MPKVIYEFDLYEDRDLLEMYQKAIDMSCALDDIYNKIRTEFKHGNMKMTDEMERFLEDIKESAGLYN